MAPPWKKGASFHFVKSTRRNYQSMRHQNWKEISIYQVMKLGYFCIAHQTRSSLKLILDKNLIFLFSLLIIILFKYPI